MTWLAWRQLRAQAVLGGLATLAVAVVLIATHGHVAGLPDPGDLSPGYQYLRLLGTVLIGAPAFIGAFWGAPLLARELEAGTHRLVWTQSVSRERWLAVKLAVVCLVAVAVIAVFSLLLTWWSLPFDRVGNRIGTANFGQRGIAPIGYVVFAVVLGTTLGAVFRRTLPAMAATFLAFFVVRFSVQLFVRPRLLGTVDAARTTTLFGPPDSSSPAAGGWILSSRTVDAAGHVVSSRAVDQTMEGACAITRDTLHADLTACATRLGFHDVVTMHPRGHFWALQGMETAIFLALALVLAGVCFWWARHRTP